jgi:hypothetical protein
VSTPRVDDLSDDDLEVLVSLSPALQMPNLEVITVAALRSMLASRPDLARVAREASRVIGYSRHPERGSALDGLSDDLRSRLLAALAGTYFMAEKVRADLGYTGPRSLPIDGAELDQSPMVTNLIAGSVALRPHDGPSGG